MQHQLLMYAGTRFISRCLFFLLVSIWGITPGAYGQNEAATRSQIVGKITDEVGNGLPGVTVSLKGTQQGTTTDADGQYKLTIPDASVIRGTLVFSFIGYLSQEITITGRTAINTSMKASEQSLNEVVVVGFGTQKKATVTGAVSSISTRDVKQSPAANLAVTLAGRLPGLTALQRSGEPGRDVTQLFIRGQGTTNAQSPIVLVDGVERDLTYIDPNEVETVTILKDASSTAIFGVRGANGVILVTTKRGSGDKPEINFTAETGIQDFTRLVKPVNAYDFATLRNQAQLNDGINPTFSATALEHYRTGDDPVRYPNTNWREMNLKKFSTQQRYNLNLSGGSKSVNYFVNAGYLGQGGQFKVEPDLNYDPSFFLNRYNFRSNVDIQLNPRLKAFLNVAGYLEKQNSPFGVFGALGGDINTNFANQSPAFYILASMFSLPATVPGPVTPTGVNVPAGQVTTSSLEVNPVYGQINRTGYIQQTRSNVIASYGMEQQLGFITPGLSAKAVVSFDTRTTSNLFAAKNYQKFLQVIDPVLKGRDGRDSVSYRQFNNDQNTPLGLSGGRTFSALSNIQAYLNYNRTFAEKHSVTGLVLYQQQQQIIDAQLPFNLRGLSSRVTYGYNDTYFAEFNVGYNGSEQFAKGQRFGFFPAVSAGWVVTNEKFLRNNPVVNLLKFRGSYGSVGNDRLGGLRFLYLDNIAVGGSGYNSSLNFGQRISESLLRNEDLQWEVAQKSNVALELGLFNALTLTVDVYNEKRSNVLRTRGTVPTLNGLPNSALPPVNIGVIENRGYEIELGYQKRFSRDFSILSKVNLNHAKNKQLFADEPLLPADYAYQYRQTGNSIGQPFGYIVDGYFQSTDEIKSSPRQVVGGHETRPGDFKYKDLNGDGTIDAKDLAPIGYSSVPQYTFGAAFNATYKNLDISFLFQGITGVSNFYQSQGVFEGANYVSRHLESWTPERVAAGLPINYPRLTTQASPNNVANSFFIVDASYIRLRNFEIGYSLPTSLVQKIGAKRIRLYSNGLNLITFDRLPTKDFDPELTGGLSYPINRLINFGANVTF